MGATMKCSFSTAFSVFLIVSVLFIALPAQAQTTIVVYPGDMGTWGWLEEVSTGTGEMVAGPATPPAGAGSAHLVVDDTGRMILGTTDFPGTPFASITSLSYGNYRAAPSDGILANTFQFNVDYDLSDGDTSWQGRLVFEPYQTGAPVPGGTWQTWDAMTDGAGWWATAAPGDTACPQSSTCTWAEVLAAFPNAGIHASIPGILLKAGGGWPGGFDGYVDQLIIGINGVDTIYDFELDVPVELLSFSIE